MLKRPDLEQARISALPLRKSCDLGQGPQVSHQFIVLPLQARNDHEAARGKLHTQWPALSENSEVPAVGKTLRLKSLFLSCSWLILKGGNIP